MPGRMTGKVALITGAGRGQGRAHAVRLAAEGARIVAVDVCADYATMPYAMATEQDLAETAALVEGAGGEILTRVADVRDQAALRAAVEAGVERFGRLDTVVANVGICAVHAWDETPEPVWKDVIDTTLTGTWNTIMVSAQHVIDAGGGSIVCIGSTAGLKGQTLTTPYTAAKHGVVGLMRSYAAELAAYGVRVNAVHPTGVGTPMGLSALEPLQRLLGERPELASAWSNALPVELIEPEDVSGAVLFLASDEGRFVTGQSFAVDAGATM